MSAENTNAGGGEICDFCPDLGAETLEPSVRDIVRSYFGCHFLDDPKRALELTDAYCAALSAQSTGSAGVAAEPVAWAWRYGSSLIEGSPLRPMWTPFDPREHHDRSLVHDVRPLYELPPGAAAPTPSRGGETERLFRQSLADHPIITETLRAAEPPPASPTGDLNSLSAGATEQCEEWCGRQVCEDRGCDGEPSKAAPAAPRKGPSEEEIAKALGEPHCWVVPGRDTANDYGSIDASCFQNGEMSRPLWTLEDIRAALVLLIPADRGETQAVGELEEDEMRRRAKALIFGSGWKIGDKLHGTALLELMVKFGSEIVARPPQDNCGYPGCGCDADAVCRDALAMTPLSPDQNRGEPDQGGAITEAGR